MQKTIYLTEGTFSGTQFNWVMGNLNSHEPKRDRLAVPSSDGGHRYVIDHLNSRAHRIGVGAFQQNGWVCDRLANTPSRQKLVAADTFKARTTTHLRFTGGKNPKIVGIGANQQSGRYVLNEAGNRKGCMATPNCTAEQTVQKTPQKVVWERLALVLNMFRDRQLFMLGAASPHDQHMIFAGGARMGDSSWRLKAYLGEVYVPGRGSVCIGYKGKPKPRKEDLKILRECLKDSTHPLRGMSLKRFLIIGHMNMTEWRKTFEENKWEIKPFDLRAIHNAWVLKHREEVIANQFANDPDSYYHYLLHHRFKGHPNLTRKFKFLWRRFKRPYVQNSLDVFLKGGRPKRSPKND